MYSVDSFFIFAKLGSKKGAKTLIIGFFVFAWADESVGGWLLTEMKENFNLHILVPIWGFKMVCKSIFNLFSKFA